MKFPKVAIITSTYNQEELLRKCLKSLKKLKYSSYKTYFIDDSGKGEIGKRIKRDFPKVKVLVNSKNKGYAISNNILFKKALREYNPKYFLHIDDDTEIVDELFLEKMVKVGEKEDKIGILGCKVIYPNKNLQWFYQKGKVRFNKNNKKIKETEETKRIKEVDNIVGSCFLIKKRVLEKVGFFDESFSPAYGEETDLCFRARKKGFKLFYVGNAKIIHHGSSSTKTIFNEKIWYLKKRNSIRLEWLNYDLSKIIYFSIVHFGSAILSKNPLKKLKILFRAYKENIKNIKEIKQKRRERNS